MESGSSVDRELVRRILWFIRLRWVAVVGALVTILTGNLVFGLAAPLPPLLCVVCSIALYNGLCHWLARRTMWEEDELARQWSTIFANAQISIDLLALTLLLHFSGGVENPFAFYFIFHIIIASILLSRLATYLQAALAIVLFNGMVFTEMTGVVNHVHLLRFLPVHLHDTIYAGTVQIVFTTTVAISVYMATSITQRLRAHELAVLSLSHQLTEKNAKLQEAFNKLSHTQTLQAQYMRKVSHELRSPLAAIESMLTLVVQKIVSSEEKRVELVERSLNRIRGLLRIVNDLLVLLRSREGKMIEQFQPVDLQTVTDKVLDLLTARAQSEGVTIETHLSPALPSVLGDPESVEQLLTNLVSNALKYTPEGGRVNLAVTSDDGRVSIEVSDTGIGIPPEDLHRIFDEFYRSKRAREFAPVGTGLGLSIVKSIVDAHRGTIEVKSAENDGTTFRVCLPTAPS